MQRIIVSFIRLDKIYIYKYRTILREKFQLESARGRERDNFVNELFYRPSLMKVKRSAKVICTAHARRRKGRYRARRVSRPSTDGAASSVPSTAPGRRPVIAERSFASSSVLVIRLRRETSLLLSSSR